MNSNNSTTAKELGYILFSDKLPQDKERINYWHDGEKEGTFDAVDNIVVEYGRLPKMWKPIKEESHVDNSKECGRSELTNAAVAHSKHSLGVVLLQHENTSLKERITELEKDNERLGSISEILKGAAEYEKEEKETAIERIKVLETWNEKLREVATECYGYFSAPNFTDRYGTAERLKEALNQK